MTSSSRNQSCLIWSLRYRTYKELVFFDSFALAPMAFYQNEIQGSGVDSVFGWFCIRVQPTTGLYLINRPTTNPVPVSGFLINPKSNSGQIRSLVSGHSSHFDKYQSGIRSLFIFCNLGLRNLKLYTQVLWPESGWKPVPLVDVIEGTAVKRSYQKALLCLHPDKLQQKGAASDQKYIAEQVFEILQVMVINFRHLGYPGKLKCLTYAGIHVYYMSSFEHRNKFSFGRAM